MLLFNKIKWYIFRKMAQENVKQGPHLDNIIKMYSIIRDAFGEEFTEDNIPTQEAFLRECFDRSNTLNG